MGAQVVGLDVKRLYAVTFGIGTACVGAAGALLLLLVDVQPYIAADYTLLAFIIVIVGGLGSMPGALVAGLLVGVSEALAGFHHPALAQEHVQLRAPHHRAAGAAAGSAGAAGMTPFAGLSRRAAIAALGRVRWP